MAAFVQVVLWAEWVVSSVAPAAPSAGGAFAQQVPVVEPQTESVLCVVRNLVFGRLAAPA